MGLEGFLDLATSTLIAGWAWDSLDPERHVAVEILVDEQPLVRIIARDYREDLKAAGIGNGTHSFSYVPAVSIGPGSTISAAIIEAGRRFPLDYAGQNPTSELHERAKAVGWFHSIDLGNGHFTNGIKSKEGMKAEAIGWKIPDDLSDKEVLDIGCADGGWSIEAMRRGARSVLSIDEQMTSGMKFLLDNNVFPIKFRQIDIFSQNFLDLPTFDIVFFCGVLYHVQHPLEALKRVRAKTRELAIIETHVNESITTNVPIMIYYERSEAGNDPTNWWGPNICCLEAMLRTAGFRAVNVFRWDGPPEYIRVAYHCTPEKGSLYSQMVEQPTVSQNMAEQYRDRMLYYYNRVIELEGQITRLKQPA